MLMIVKIVVMEKFAAKDGWRSKTGNKNSVTIREIMNPEAVFRTASRSECFRLCIKALYILLIKQSLLLYHLAKQQVLELRAILWAY